MGKGQLERCASHRSESYTKSKLNVSYGLSMTLVHFADAVSRFTYCTTDTPITAELTLGDIIRQIHAS